MAKNKLKLFWLILLFFSSEYLFAQAWDPWSKAFWGRRLDSLRLDFKTATSDSSKLYKLNVLAGLMFSTTVNSDGKNWDSTIYYANTALTFAVKLKNRWEEGRAIYTLGIVLQKQGKYAEALKKFFTVLKISDEINDKPCAQNQCLSIGNIYSDIGNYKEALQYYFKGLHIIKEGGLKISFFQFYRYMGLTYHRMGNYAEALKYFFDALIAGKENNNITTISIIDRYIGNVYADMGNYSKALEYHFIALNETLKTRQFKPFLDKHYTDIGTVYYKQAAALNDEDAKVKYTEALNYLQKGLVIAQEIQDESTVLDAYFGLSTAYKGIDDAKNALHYLNLYLLLKDSLYNNELYTKISDINTQNELEKARIEEQSRQQLTLANEMRIREKLLGEQKLQQEKVLSDEKVANEKAIADQKLEQEKKSAEELNKYDKSIADEKAKQEKIKTEKEQVNNLLLMGLILVIITSVFLILLMRQRNQKKRAVEKAETIHKMAELEMQSLRSQLNPHFMFNSLNSIQTLILKEDTDRSQSYLSRFARLLRILLENADAPFISLRKEIDFLQLYLSLESLRVPDLQYSISTDPDLNTEQTQIPNMFLQPYVENAIWHGLSYKETDKQLQIRIYRENGAINYEIEDNGVGRKKAEELKSLFRKQHQSKGMELLSKRVKLLNKEYSSTIQTEIVDVIKNNEISGTRVTVKVPLKLYEPLQN